MRKPRYFLSLILYVGVSSLLSGCFLFRGDRAQERTGVKLGPHGCPRPTVFTFTDEDVKTVWPKLGSITLGDIKYKSETKVLNLVSEGARDAEVRAYLICEAQREGVSKGWLDSTDAAQMVWVQNKWALIASGAAAEQLEKWDNEHPFPLKKKED